MRKGIIKGIVVALVATTWILAVCMIPLRIFLVAWETSKDILEDFVNSY